jgi:oligopeptide transport system substrate-binding protein
MQRKIMNKILIKNLASFLLCAIFAVEILSCSQKKLDTDLHIVLRENPRSLDPILSADAVANEAMDSVYETLMQYHYLKRPYVVIPLLAEKFPEYSKDGLTVTVHIKKNVHFQDDPCFPNGKGRELEAQDFVYAFKRLLDPKNLSEGGWIFENKVLSFSAPDKYTLVFKLKTKYPQLNNVLTMAYTSPMPHEAISKYGPEIVNHPVGTGPFVVKEYIRNSQIVYERNPNFHGENFPEQVAGYENLDFGKPLPRVDRIVAHIITEPQPQWLQFMSGQLDLVRLEKDNYSSTVGADHELRPEISKKGIQLSKNPSTTEWFIGFNMEDPVLGKNKNLRRAIGFAYNSEKEIELFTNGRAAPSNQILPPQIAGFVKDVPPREFNVEKAKKFMKEAGFPGGKGSPRLVFETEGTSAQRQAGEFFKDQMAQIGLNIEVHANTRPELMEKRRRGKVQVEMGGWIADYPDAENFMQLLYGPNRAPGSNASLFNNPEYNSLYEEMAGLAPSPRRQKIIDRMTAIFLEELPWIPNWRATLYWLNQGWVKNYIYSDISNNNYKYYGLDLEKKREIYKNF